MFFTFEGCEGSGKSTLIQSLKDQLELDGYNVIITREPGGSDLGEKIRQLIINENMSAETEALLFAANRFDHIEYLKSLPKETIILCDRFVHSSYAYQGRARKLGIDKISQFNYFVKDFFPDLSFYIKIRPEVGLDRIRANSRDTNRLDDELITFHHDVRDAYDMMKDLIHINGEQKKDQVFKDCYKIIKSYLKENE